MANKYFIAGVGRALLFKGETLFADCRTLADSSITIGVTAEDIRGGEGNKLWGQYFHDSTFSMKLTDIMFNLEYIAANVGAEIANKGNVFKTETLKAEGGKLTLSKTPVPIVTNGTAKVFYRKAADANADMKEMAALTNEITVDGADGTEYCVLYRYEDNEAQTVTVNAQFIPETLHAVLTVALYAGDSCNVESATKAGEIEIDIPRFQLTGAMDISMTATGASQTPLEGNALASGCAGCEGNGIYATITKVLFNANWYDNAEGLIIEDNYAEAKVGTLFSRPLVVYAYYNDGAPKQIDASKLTFSINPELGLSVENGLVTGTPTQAGTAIVTVNATGKDDLKTYATIIVTD